MGEREYNMVRVTVVLALCVSLFIGGCQFFPFNETQAQSGCPWTPVSARAWVNRMPGPNRPDAAPLIVHLELAKQSTPVMMMRSTHTTSDTLVLELSQSDDTRLGLRGAAYRETSPTPLYKNIIIRCSGAELTRIDAIQAVH